MIRMLYICFCHNKCWTGMAISHNFIKGGQLDAVVGPLNKIHIISAEYAQPDLFGENVAIVLKTDGSKAAKNYDTFWRKNHRRIALYP